MSCDRIIAFRHAWLLPDRVGSHSNYTGSRSEAYGQPALDQRRVCHYQDNNSLLLHHEQMKSQRVYQSGGVCGPGEPDPPSENSETSGCFVPVFEVSLLPPSLILSI